MKTVILVLLTLSVTAAFGQDLIRLHDGRTIKARIIESTMIEIKYRDFDTPEGPVRGLLKIDISRIDYENGKKESFNQDSEEDFIKAGDNPDQEPVVQEQKLAPSAMTQKPKEAPRKVKVPPYKGLKRSGMILSIFGSAALVGGIVAMNNSPSGYDANSDLARDLSGVFAITSGAICLGVGIPLWIAGANVQRRYNQQKRNAGITLLPTGNGMSLRLRF